MFQLLSQDLLLAQSWSDLLQIQKQLGGPPTGAGGTVKKEKETEKAVLQEFKGGEVVGRGEWPMAHSVVGQRLMARWWSEAGWMWHFSW